MNGIEEILTTLLKKRQSNKGLLGRENFGVVKPDGLPTSYGDEQPQSDLAASLTRPRIARRDGQPATLPTRRRTVPYEDLSLDDAITQDEKRIRELGDKPLPKENSFLKRLATGIGESQKNLPANTPLEFRLGALLGGGAGAGFVPQYDQQVRTEREKSKLAKRLGMSQQQKIFETQQAAEQARIENIAEDNRLNREKAQEKAAQFLSEAKRKRRADFYRQNKNFDPTKATEAQVRQLAEFDETPDSIGKYDFTNPKFKQIGDTTFKWDVNEQAFVDSGLPKDKTKALTEITLKDPADGKSYTMITTAEKAASYLNSRVVAGMQIEAAKDRQLSQQKWQAEQNDKNRAQALQISNQRIAIANQQIQIAQQRLDNAAEKDKAQAQKDLENAKLAKKRLKAYILNNPLISDSQDLLEGLDDEP